ncbi:beta-lactoglobulin-1A/1C-like [Heteronotia binoei]|uniref:beta-lactoglobulin-1A/1C-like n=1 Tax=Heteronotia binoei TaxID=13085 RepID=UPI002931C6F5|nr:beta-lactoglobulin-1A/1C-like [Heteronotia binoei]XP_060107288.1 beta-lactoglobulin-1A/1C-like [Heteronotia binoei]XP_060107463.1 beta-lactoglobulin-1A/1C-like [Heteronotia binoei]
MKGGLFVGLSALVCQILAQVKIPSVQDFDVKKFAGQWYLIAMVMDEVVIEDAVNVGTTATPVGSRDVLLNIVLLKNDNCTSEKVNLMQTLQPGVFKVTGCDITIHMVEVDYGSYHILHFTTVNNRILHLYSKCYGG